MKTLLIAAALTATLSADMCNFYAEEAHKSQSEMIMFYKEGMKREFDRSKMKYKKYHIKAIAECTIGEHSRLQITKDLVKNMEESYAVIKKIGWL